MADTWGDNFIQAYLGGVKTRLEKEGQLAQQQQFNDNLKQNQDRLKMEMQHVDQLHQAELARQGFETENLKSKILDQFKSGTRVAPPALNNPVMPGQQDVQLSPVSMVNQQPQEATINQGPSYMGTSTPDPTQYVDVDPRLGTGGSLKIEGATTPDLVDKRTMKEKMLEAQVAIAKAAGIKQAEAPIVRETNRLNNDQKTTGQLSVEAEKTKAAKELRTAQDAAALERVKLTAGAQILGHRIAADASKYATDNKKSNSVDPAVLTDNAMLSATGHGGTIPGWSPTGMALKSQMKKLDLVPFESKDAEKLKAVSDTDVLFKFIEDHVSKMPDSEVGAWLEKMSAKIPGTDISNAYGMVFGRAANTSHAWGGEVGRLSDPDVIRSMMFMGGPGSGKTKQQQIEAISQIKQEYQSKIVNHILAGQKPHQQLMNLEEYGRDPSSLLIKAADGKLHQQFQQNSAGQWGILNPKTLDVTVIK